ncbi:MAG TPA: polyphenol oxidase family protein [Gemmatimonadota bacterium]|nr:polyphenol oxidase family protein [Gemmatimonadota bacterium]
MTRAVEARGPGFPHLEVGWPGLPLAAGITLRPAAENGPGRDPALEGLRSWAAGRFDGLVGATQVHGARIFDVDGVRVPETAGSAGPFVLRVAGYDGLLTNRPGRLLTVGAADCVPALLYAPRAGVVALLHAGWRGIAAGILPAALERLSEAGARPADVLAWWGPAVGPCCYPVGEEVVEALRATEAGPEADGWVRRGPGGPRVDLREALTSQAAARGIPRGAVTASSRCTSCAADLFFSHRRDPSGGRMLAFAGLPRPD